MLIHSASQLLTLAGAPQRGGDLGRLGIIPDGALLIRDGVIAAVGASQELRQAYPAEETLNARGHVVMPGFVDPHTHAIWAGDRAAEFEMRLEGKTYLEILAAGGGILSTVKATRQASLEDLLEETRPRLWTMLEHGTTTAEVKTGYGLETETELRLLQALAALDREGPLELALTFLGAHAIAPEYKANPEGYTDHLCEEMLPAVQRWWQKYVPEKPLPFVDVFCETGAFSLEQSERILQTASSLGFPLKIHADEFDNLVAEDHILLHFLPAQVEITILQADFLADFFFLIDEEWQHLGLVKDIAAGDLHLDFTSGKIRVFSAFGSFPHNPGDLKHPFLACFLDGSHFRSSRIPNDLDQARAVTQVDERYPAKVALTGYPPCQSYSLPDMR